MINERVLARSETESHLFPTFLAFGISRLPVVACEVFPVKSSG